MTTYALYLESGPKKRKTMVHVLGLPGCIANGPTTDDALAATPEAIRAYLRFLARHSLETDPDGAFDTEVREHITEGEWLGNGSTYVVFQPDLEPISEPELHEQVERWAWMREDLAAWAEAQPGEQLDSKPEAGRAKRAILLHVLGPSAGYLSPILGMAPGYSRLVTRAERGVLPLPEAFRQSIDIVRDHALQATGEQRRAVIERPKERRTLRKSLRRMLEHEWEHVAELSRRPGGPQL